LEKESKVLTKIKEFLDEPGVYIMKNEKAHVIYVGKAKSLKKRVQSYFSGTKDLKTRLLLEHVDDIEVIITRNEYEALLTEISLIKKWQPKYNINLKDGKTYPVIRLTNETYPRVFRTRRLVLDGSRYFGPFPKVEDIDAYLHVIEKLYPLRKCRGPLKKKREPCMYYHIGRCPGICAGKMTDEEYKARVEKVVLLLEGNTDEIIRELKEKMNQAATDLHYERAAVYRDELLAVTRLAETQAMWNLHKPTEDFMGLAVKDNFASFIVMKMQEGRLVTKEAFQTHFYSGEEEALIQFLFQYYSRVQKLPDAIYLPLLIDAEVREAFGKSFNTGVPLLVPEAEKDKTVLRMAQANAEQALRISHIDGLVELKTLLGLADLPLRIEGFDIAHLDGTHTVASLVSFHQGRPDKDSYRRFKIKSLDGAIDDYEAIREVVARRYTRLAAEKEPLPDLILIDGGKGQLESARGILESLELENIPVIGLAKKREEIFLPHNAKPLVLPHTSPALRILVAVRDESHRFATSYHKLLRDREMASSALEKIKGIGKKKAKLLITHFHSLENIMKSDIGEISKIGKVKEEIAVSVINEVKKILGEG
jgi:excinuclease ABC subunit C